MSHSFLVVPTALLPDWTKQNVPFYDLAVFSNDGQFVLMDNAHPVSTYQKWLGPNFHLFDSIMEASVVLTAEEIRALRAEPGSVWYGGVE